MPKDISVALKYRDAERTASRFPEPPDIILPSQYFGVIRGYGHLTPEQKLMLAVLESAVHDFQRYRLASGRRGKRIFREAQEWLTSQEETGIFSFVVICHALGIDGLYPYEAVPTVAGERVEKVEVVVRNGREPGSAKGSAPRAEGDNTLER